MVTSDKGIQFIAQCERFRDAAYQDGGGVWTIGYGHTADVEAGDICAQPQALLWLKSDLSTAERCVNSLVMGTLQQNQFDALVSWVFNLGCGNFFSSTLRKKLNSGDYNGAANEMIRWTKIGGKFSQGLLNRRLLEQKMFLGVDDESN